MVPTFFELHGAWSMKILPFLLLFLMFIGCNQRIEKPCSYTIDTSSVSMDLIFEQYEDSVTQFNSKEQLVHFFSRHPVIQDFFFHRPAYSNDSIFINELFLRFNNAGLNTLLKETKQVFGDMSRLKEDLKQAFIQMRHYYPDFTPPKIQTIITGLETDLYVSDTLVIVGLDYYLGSGATYRPRLYNYLLSRYQKNFIVPSILLLYGIDRRYNKTNLNDKTVLADMMTYGKAYYFAKCMLPCVSDSVLIGYTEKEIEGSKQNRALIWKRLIQDEVFYSTSHLMKQKYIEERPKTLEVGNQCPGRIATWVGWEIVKEYMKKNPEMSLPNLMENSNAEKIFRQSAYRPM